MTSEIVLEQRKLKKGKVKYLNSIPVNYHRKMYCVRCDKEVWASIETISWRAKMNMCHTKYKPDERHLWTCPFCGATAKRQHGSYEPHENMLGLNYAPPKAVMRSKMIDHLTMVLVFGHSNIIVEKHKPLTFRDKTSTKIRLKHHGAV